VFFDPLRVVHAGNFLLFASLDPGHLLVPISKAGENYKAAQDDNSFLLVLDIGRSTICIKKIILES